MDATAIFPTDQAERHMATLVDHFARKVPAFYDAQSGCVEFPFGRCDLAASQDHLRLVASADDQEQLGTVVDVITRHLERFAFRENPILDWQPNTGND